MGLSVMYFVPSNELVFYGAGFIWWFLGLCIEKNTDKLNSLRPQILSMAFFQRQRDVFSVSVLSFSAASICICYIPFFSCISIFYWNYAIVLHLRFYRNGDSFCYLYRDWCWWSSRLRPDTLEKIKIMLKCFHPLKK